MRSSLRYPLAVLRYLVSKMRPRLRWILGKPHYATIAPWCDGGYVLKLHHDQGVEWIPLTTDTGRDRPDDRDFALAADVLTARGLAWIPPFGLDPDGNLTAPVTSLLTPAGGTDE
jgi:hypothetical protein